MFECRKFELLCRGDSRIARPNIEQIQRAIRESPLRNQIGVYPAKSQFICEKANAHPEATDLRFTRSIEIAESARLFQSYTLGSFYTIRNCAKPTSPFVSFRYRKASIGEQPGAATCRFLSFI